MRNMRYYLEDKPQYLDDPEGEYWFEKKGTGGRLYLRLPGDADPNFAQIEAGKEMNLVEGTNVEHVHITGLTFRFTTPAWDISSSPWDFSTKPWGLRPAMHPGCVRVWGSGRLRGRIPQVNSSTVTAPLGTVSGRIHLSESASVPCGVQEG